VVVGAQKTAMIEKIPIGNDAHWHGLRQHDVTASTAAALLGVHPYMTPLGLWLLKSGRDTTDPEETPPMRRGRLLEPVAVELLREEYPSWKWKFSSYPHGYYYRDESCRIGATPDLVVEDESGRQGVIQIKTIEPWIFKRNWRDDESENVAPPLWVAVQAILEAYLTGSDWAAVMAMRVSHGLEYSLVPVPVHTGIIDRLKGEVAAFWVSVANDKAPDPDHNRDLALLERLFTNNETIADLTADNELVALADERATVTEARKAADVRLAAIKAELLAKLGGAGAGRIADGRLITAKRVNRKAYEVGPSSYVTVTIKGSSK
jgi:YqaJ-like viral recombinase domain